MKNKILLSALALIVVLALAFSYNILGSKVSNESNGALAGSFDGESIPLAAAQEKVDFEIIIPETPEDFEDPIIQAFPPPAHAVTDPQAIKDLTQIHTIYTSKKKTNDVIIVTQADNEIVPMDASTGEPIEPMIIKIEGKEINFFECECEPPLKKYWWYEDGATVEVKVYGEIKDKKINKVISKLLKDSKK